MSDPLCSNKAYLHKLFCISTKIRHLETKNQWINKGLLTILLMFPASSKLFFLSCFSHLWWHGCVVEHKRKWIVCVCLCLGANYSVLWKDREIGDSCLPKKVKKEGSYDKISGKIITLLLWFCYWLISCVVLVLFKVSEWCIRDILLYMQSWNLNSAYSAY
jgi:uncharacterized membrane protein